MLGGVFQRGVNLFNLLLSAINALTGLVVGMIAPSVRCLCGGRVKFSLWQCVRVQWAAVREPTVDNKLSVLLL